MTEASAAPHSVHGETYVVIDAAVQELKRHNLDVVGYKIDVKYFDDKIEVIFIDRNHPPDAVGSVGKLGTVVELEPETLKVLRYYYMR